MSARMLATSHFGEGPGKGPAYGDEVEAIVRERLTWSDEIDASHVEVDVHEGHVVLRGWVPTEWERSAAEEDIAALAGVTSIDNQLEVRAF